MEIWIGVLEAVRVLVIVVCVACTFRMLYLLTEERSKHRGTKAELTRVNRRSKHWKHYAHILEVRSFYGQPDSVREAFRARYIHDFRGWGSHAETDAGNEPELREREPADLP